MNNILVKNYSFHRHVLLEITKQCNLQCLHCFTEAGHSLTKELELDDWKLVLKDLIDNGFNAFTISGGEPLLVLKETISLVKYIKQLNRQIKVYIFTNGILFNKTNLRTFKKYVDGVGISIDGCKRTHDWLRRQDGSYTAAIHALSLLQAKKIPVFVQSMITPQTLPYMEDIVKLCINKGVRAIRFSHVDFYGRAIEHKQTIGCDEKHLILLNSTLKHLKDKYNICLTSNLVNKTELQKNKVLFTIPSLHILPNGYVLPWYGFPLKLALCKYPTETFSNLKQQVLDARISAFKEIMEESQVYVSHSNMGNNIDYDNIVAHFFD